MRAETRLDWATFQLDEARSRCELWVAAGSETEKLASGSLKPFLAHLKEAQEQISRGQSSIKLQLSSGTGKAPWFTKGTMERFVRFVTTPDVLERLSIVEKERRQLEEAINILAVGDQQIKQTSTGMAFEGEDENTTDGDVSGDNSKNQLLVAMDARRIMLQKEQLNAFNRAAAAGFDLACMADMVDFADCFGAARLRDACLKFASICKRMQEKGELEVELLATTGSGASSSSARSEEKASKARKTWVAQETGEQQGPGQDDRRLLESALSTQASYTTPVKSHPQDFRIIPDSPPNIADADSPLTEGGNSQQDTPNSRRLPRRVSSPRRRSCSPMRRVQIARSGSKRGGMVVVRNINYTSPGSPRAPRLASGADESSTDSDSVVESEDTKDELHRRLSVQDAISIFEQKQKLSLEAQSVKSDSRRVSVDPQSSSKSVLRRWSSIGEHSSGIEMGEVSKVSESDEASDHGVEQESERRKAPQQQPQQESSAAKLDERRKSWLTAQNDLEWKFQQLKLQEAALPAVRSSRESTRSPQQKQPGATAGATMQFGFQYRGQKPSKSPVSRSWSATSEKDLASVVRQAEVEEKKKNDQKSQQHQVEDHGRFYEQYRERRDAKIRQESDLKRAERESKLKAMQEMLDKRKAELVAGTRSAERQAKSSALNKKTPQSGRTTSTRSPVVSASQTTPRAARQQLTPEPKNSVARKLSPGPQKPPSLTRGLASSPKAPAKNNVTATQRRPSNIAENPLSRSMPSLSELRKENTKPARSSQQTKAPPPPAKTSSKPGSNMIRNKALSKVLPLEPNGVTPPEAQVSKDNRKFPVTITEEPQTPAPVQVMMDSQLPVPSSVYDAKSFLRKGRGIGPGAGPGVMKQKAASAPEPDIEENNPIQHEEVSSFYPVKAEDEAPLPDISLKEKEPAQVPGSVRESQEMEIDDGMEDPIISVPEEVKIDQAMEPVERLVHEVVPQLTSNWMNKSSSATTEASPSKVTLMQQLATEEQQVAALRTLGDRRPSMLSVGSSSSPSSSTSGAPLPALQQSMAPDLDGVKTRKKWGSSDKPVITQQASKEGPKGFKRLLKFGRKSRGNSTSEWVSASTTSEGEDTDDTGNSNGSSYLRRSVEAFSKEHDNNGSRSFFSLSSFRSKSSELKAKF